MENQSDVGGNDNATRNGSEGGNNNSNSTGNAFLNGSANLTRSSNGYGVDSVSSNRTGASNASDRGNTTFNGSGVGNASSLSSAVTSSPTSPSVTSMPTEATSNTTASNVCHTSVLAVTYEGLSTDCSPSMLEGQRCAVTCPAGERSIGYFTCSSGEFVGESTCVELSEARGIQTVMKVASTMQVELRVNLEFSAEAFRDVLKRGIANGLSIPFSHVMKVLVEELDDTDESRRLDSVQRRVFEISYEAIPPIAMSPAQLVSKAEGITTQSTIESQAFLEVLLSESSVSEVPQVVSKIPARLFQDEAADVFEFTSISGMRWRLVKVQDGAEVSIDGTHLGLYQVKNYDSDLRAMDDDTRTNFRAFLERCGVLQQVATHDEVTVATVATPTSTEQVGVEQDEDRIIYLLMAGVVWCIVCSCCVGFCVAQRRMPPADDSYGDSGVLGDPTFMAIGTDIEAGQSPTLLNTPERSEWHKVTKIDYRSEWHLKRELPAPTTAFA